MARYIQFTTSDGSTVLVEVEEEEVSPPRGVVKAGVADKVKETVAQAQATLEGSLERVVRHNAETFIEAVRKLSLKPDEMEVTFGLKATGEVGNWAIAKGGTEMNFEVKLTWTRGAEQG